MKRRDPFPGVNKTFDRHGKPRWRLRRSVKGRKVDCYIAAPYGSTEFRAQYEAAIAGESGGGTRSAVGTFDHLIEAYFKSREWKSLRASTQKAKRNRLEYIRQKIGTAQIAALQPRHVAKLMEMKRGPTAANRLSKDLAQLYAFAARHLGFTGAHPTKAVERIKVRSKGFHTWTNEQVEAFRTYHPKGSMARLAFEIALGTGAARQDVARMGKGNLLAGAIVYARGKTGGRVELPLALLPELAAELALHRADGPVFVTRSNGDAYSVGGFGNWFRDRVREAGLPPVCGMHGLRKHGAMRLAERGATEFQIMAFLGHESPQEARRYVAAANRATLAADGLRLLNQPKLPNPISGLGKNDVQLAVKKGKK